MCKLKIKPIGHRILLQRIEDKEQVRGGVIIPDNAKEQPQEARVIAFGTGSKAKDVLVGKFAGSEVKLGDQKYTLVREDDILGVIA